MAKIHRTQYFEAAQDKEMAVSDVLEDVYLALTEKGYNPLNQIGNLIAGYGSQERYEGGAGRDHRRTDELLY